MRILFSKMILWGTFNSDCDLCILFKKFSQKSRPLKIQIQFKFQQRLDINPIHHYFAVFCNLTTYTKRQRCYTLTLHFKCSAIFGLIFFPVQMTQDFCIEQVFKHAPNKFHTFKFCTFHFVKPCVKVLKQHYQCVSRNAGATWEISPLQFEENCTLQN